MRNKYQILVGKSHGDTAWDIKIDLKEIIG
jgi:hypothetical protein